ncbi:MAG: hypothetical protein HZB29_00245 [Nitrospinae bacterium]|nr:hypothetical protein [Nitrospinota bacterium]
MAVGRMVNSPLVQAREEFALQAKVKEAKVLGPEGARTDIIQKLALTAQPSRKQINAAATPAPKKDDGKGISAAAPAKKETKLGAAAAKTQTTKTQAAKPQGAKPETKSFATPTLTPASQANIANVYSGSDGFKAVA